MHSGWCHVTLNETTLLLVESKMFPYTQNSQLISWDPRHLEQYRLNHRRSLKSKQPSINLVAAAAAAKSLQSCLTLCHPIDGSPPGSPVPGILQARTLEWITISFSSAWKWEVKVKSLSRVRLLATPWTAAYQAPPSMGFSRQEYWSGVPLPSPKLSSSLGQTSI